MLPDTKAEKFSLTFSSRSCIVLRLIIYLFFYATDLLSYSFGGQSPKWVLPSQNQGVSTAVFSSGSSKGKFFSLPFQLLEAAHIPQLIACYVFRAINDWVVFIPHPYNTDSPASCFPLRDPYSYGSPHRQPRKISSQNQLFSHLNSPLPCIITYL